MKIKEKIKNFVEEHEEQLVIAGCGVMAVVGTVVVSVASFKLGERFTLDKIKELTGISFTKEFAYSVKDGILKDVHKEALTDVLEDCGFTSLDDPTKIAVLIQKK